MARISKHYKTTGTAKRRRFPKRSPHGKSAKPYRQMTSFRMKPEAEAALKDTFSRIGKPPSEPFRPDEFQLRALDAIIKTDCLVIAPTGAGKTWIAEQAIASIFNAGGRCWYASPLKALTNSKWVEFGERFGRTSVGILTGDTKENADAPIVVGTTEILRNQLYDAMHRGEDLNYDLVILDEAHFLGDEDRGVVWEEVMIYLPTRINLLLLSATIGNGEEIASWLESIRNKECIIVMEDRRPVPLYPLFLHPSGRIMPFLSRKKIYRKVSSFLEEKPTVYQRGTKLPPFGDIINVLRKFRLLPAIFFLKSRVECDVAINLVETSSHVPVDEPFDNDLNDILEYFPYLKNHSQLRNLRRCRVGAHHGGQLPAWKFMVEMMMKGGHLDAVFATSTVAAGVNFPARSVVLFNSDQFNGHEFRPLDATAFHQMTGRAGRRGQDNIGFMVIVPQRYMDTGHIRKLLFTKPTKIISRIRNDFSMVLNLLLSHTPEDIRNIFNRSFSDFQQITKKHQGARSDLWKNFQKHLSFLRSEGFVDTDDGLTEEGIWTSQLRLDHPLLIAECLKRNAFPRDDDALLAACVAPFVSDRDVEIPIKRREHSKKLMTSYDMIIAATAPLSKRMREAGFDVGPLQLWAAVAVYRWARGVDWTQITSQLKIADGDLTMLISRTADNLNQIASLKFSHPDVASCAAAARRTLLREPVVFEEPKSLS